LLLYGLQQKDPALLSLICLALLAARLCFWLLYRSRVRSAKAPAATLSCLAQIHLFHVLAGHFFPALLVTVALLMPQVATASASAAGLLALLAGWHLKFTLITRAAQVQGYRLGAVRRGRPVVRPPVRRKPDRAAS
jgi:phenylacetyl-CoA:acceptor oxidoreductase subunit 2